MKTSPIPPLPPRDQQHLLAAEGWLELGNHLEANAELEEIAAPLRSHPFVLEVRWAVCSQAKKWEDCVEVGHAIVRLVPDHEFGWIRRSFALHELGRTFEAYELLQPAAPQFPQEWSIPYNLACYCAQLGRLEESQVWLKQAMTIDAEEIQAAAVDDPDLKPLWDSLGGTFWRK